jgi:hypothetical protein
MINLEKEYQLHKRIKNKKITITKIMIKIEIQNKFYIFIEW